jgi:hypothetical protein
MTSRRIGKVISWSWYHRPTDIVLADSCSSFESLGANGFLLLLVEVQSVLSLVEDALFRLGLVLAVTTELLTMLVAGATTSRVEILVAVRAQSRLGDDLFGALDLVADGVQLRRVDIASTTTLKGCISHNA